MTTLKLALAAALFGALFANTALADESKNLKVLSKEHKEKEIENGMKEMTKGLGVKCETCHVKDKADSDDKKPKLAGREFLTAVVGEKDAAKRKAALDTLLAALKLKAARSEAQIWKGVDTWKKQ
ncbi:MAG: hypothetical protein IT384_26010 [Deltaproteobacteria bacterium]|nr:hypothetical protein [Deltaproteobacteria bacterium]